MNPHLGTGGHIFRHLQTNYIRASYSARGTKNDKKQRPQAPSDKSE